MVHEVPPRGVIDALLAVVLRGTLRLLLKPVFSPRFSIACQRGWIEVRPEVFRAHNQRLQERLAGSVWSLCRSWYRTQEGRIVALFPGFTAEYVKAVRRPDLNDYRMG